ncbi:hypothetical protein F5146DRAFT_1003153 [Armillaria mellea]|nr:hypothetical protein F5146DRAFT_1003153 [Armillaria mellea]
MAGGQPNPVPSFHDSPPAPLSIEGKQQGRTKPLIAHRNSAGRFNSSAPATGDRPRGAIECSLILSRAQWPRIMESSALRDTRELSGRVGPDLRRDPRSTLPKFITKGRPGSPAKDEQRIGSHRPAQILLFCLNAGHLSYGLIPAVPKMFSRVLMEGRSSWEALVSSNVAGRRKKHFGLGSYVCVGIRPLYPPAFSAYPTPPPPPPPPLPHVLIPALQINNPYLPITSSLERTANAYPEPLEASNRQYGRGAATPLYEQENRAHKTQTQTRSCVPDRMKIRRYTYAQLKVQGPELRAKSLFQVKGQYLKTGIREEYKCAATEGQRNG